MLWRDWLSLLFLGAIWGASFLFLRIAVPEVGVLTTASLRITLAALVMLPLFFSAKHRQAYRAYWRHVWVLGLLNYALPFSLLAYATQTIAASVASILNATAPIWAALVAWLWLRHPPGRQRILGMLLGLGGVLVLSSGKTGADSSIYAILAALTATLSYGSAANYSKKYLVGMPVSSLVLCSQSCAALLILPLGLTHWPTHPIHWHAWLAILALAIACTSIANLVYFRLIARLGPAPAISSTFLIPMFGMLWGGVFLSEPITLTMLLGCVVILFGTALTTGAFKALWTAFRAHSSLP